MRIDWSTYKNHAGRLANLIGTYEKQRKALDNPMYSAEYKQEQAANLRAGVRAAVGETLAAIREQIGKDAEAARYRAPEVPIEQQAAHFAERTPTGQRCFRRNWAHWGRTASCGSMGG